MSKEYPGNLPVRTTASVEGEMELVVPVDVKVAGRPEVEHVIPPVSPHSHHEMSVARPVVG